MIPGWRVLISDVGRFWATRDEPLSRGALRAGAEPVVDADTVAELEAETARQEEIVREAAATADRQRKGVQWTAEAPADPQRNVARTVTHAPADRRRETTAPEGVR